MILAGDIGGTKTLLSLYAFEGGTLRPKVSQKYDSAHFASLDVMVRAFLEKECGSKPDAACFGVPGPVSEGQVRTTNLPWHLSESELSRSLDISKVRLVNDLVAFASGAMRLPDESLEVLHKGNSFADANVSAVIAPGTGLGQAAVHFVNGTPLILGSEGGHADFAPRNEVEMALLTYLLTKLKRVSVERLLSGPGLFHIYSFFRDTKRGEESAEIASLFSSSDPSKVIAEAALSGSDELCTMALDLFVAMLGSHAGNMMLTYMSTRGVYLGGGIPPKILSKLRDGSLVENYLTKGRLSPMVEATPLYVIKDDRTGLHGAAYLASTL